VSREVTVRLQVGMTLSRNAVAGRLLKVPIHSFISLKLSLKRLYSGSFAIVVKLIMATQLSEPSHVASGSLLLFNRAGGLTGATDVKLRVSCGL